MAQPVLSAVSATLLLIVTPKAQTTLKDTASVGAHAAVDQAGTVIAVTVRYSSVVLIPRQRNLTSLHRLIATVCAALDLVVRLAQGTTRLASIVTL